MVFRMREIYKLLDGASRTEEKWNRRNIHESTFWKLWLSYFSIVSSELKFNGIELNGIELGWIEFNGENQISRLLR